jgi:uncharacterized protein (DUF2461 family)
LSSAKSCRSGSVRKTFSEFEGNALVRPPKGFPKEHPALDLIRCRQWGLSTTLPAAAALEDGFAATLIRHFRLAAPVVEALNTPIAATRPAKRCSSAWIEALRAAACEMGFTSGRPRQNR